MKRRSLIAAVVAMTVAVVQRPAVAGTVPEMGPAAKAKGTRARPPVSDVMAYEWGQLDQLAALAAPRASV